VRVVAGLAKGRRLVAPPGLDTRPTSDRVREATFNALESMGAIQDAVVLDLFAGTGALGIEALSRGAAACTFVDADRRCIEAIETNVDACGFRAQATIVRTEALVFLRSDKHVDLALLDPPYAFGDWHLLFAALDAGLAVIESDRPVDPGPGRRTVRTKRYGGTVVAIIAPDTAAKEP